MGKWDNVELVAPVKSGKPSRFDNLELVAPAQPTTEARDVGSAGGGASRPRVDVQSPQPSFAEKAGRFAKEEAIPIAGQTVGSLAGGVAGAPLGPAGILTGKAAGGGLGYASGVELAERVGLRPKVEGDFAKNVALGAGGELAGGAVAAGAKALLPRIAKPELVEAAKQHYKEAGRGLVTAGEMAPEKGFVGFARGTAESAPLVGGSMTRRAEGVKAQVAEVLEKGFKSKSAQGGKFAGDPLAAKEVFEADMTAYFDAARQTKDAMYDTARQYASRTPTADELKSAFGGIAESPEHIGLGADATVKSYANRLWKAIQEAGGDNAKIWDILKNNKSEVGKAARGEIDPRKKALYQKIESATEDVQRSIVGEKGTAALADADAFYAQQYKAVMDAAKPFLKAPSNRLVGMVAQKPEEYAAVVNAMRNSGSPELAASANELASEWLAVGVDKMMARGGGQTKAISEFLATIKSPELRAQILPKDAERRLYNAAAAMELASSIPTKGGSQTAEKLSPLALFTTPVAFAKWAMFGGAAGPVVNSKALAYVYEKLATNRALSPSVVEPILATLREMTAKGAPAVIGGAPREERGM